MIPLSLKGRERGVRNSIEIKWGKLFGLPSERLEAYNTPEWLLGLNFVLMSAGWDLCMQSLLVITGFRTRPS